jgi:hypothetical protein
MQAAVGMYPGSTSADHCICLGRLDCQTWQHIVIPLLATSSTEYRDLNHPRSLNTADRRHHRLCIA